MPRLVRNVRLPAGSAREPSQMPRSRPTSDIRCSASRSAAADGGTPRTSAICEDARGGTEDLLRPRPGPLEAESGQFIGDLDHPARVDHVVRGVQDPAVGQQLLHPGVRELVVGPAADDLGVQGGGHRDRRPSRPARTARTRPGRRPAVRPAPATTSISGCRARTPSTAVSLTSQMTTSAPSSTRWPTSLRPTLPTPSTPTRRPRRLVRAPDVPGGGPHALEHPERGQHRRVAGAAVRGGAPGDASGTPGR